MLTPVAFLNRAANFARSQPDRVPRPDQFLYLKDGTYEAWLSMDGTHDGRIDNPTPIVVYGCRNGVQHVGGNASGTTRQACTPRPAYLADAPITAQAMADYITTLSGSPSSPNSLGKTLLGIAELNYLRPAARAARFEAAPLLPGLHLTSAKAPNFGEDAVAITWSFGGGPTTLLFSDSTYAYLGATTTDENGARNGSGRPVRQAIVNAVGRRA